MRRRKNYSNYSDEELIRDLKQILYFGRAKDSPKLWEILDELRDREIDAVNEELEREAENG